MSLIVFVACVLSAWALLSLIGSERVARQQVVDDAAAARAAVAKRRAAAAEAAEAEAGSK